MARVVPTETTGDAGPVVHTGGPDAVLSGSEVRAAVTDALGRCDLDGRSLCVVVPDTSRACPLPLLVDAVHAAVRQRVSRLSVLVALGTHPPLPGRALAAHLGAADGDLERRLPGTRVVNHRWQDASALTPVGRISGSRLAELSGGWMTEGVDVRVNRTVVDHDVVLLLGPVLPHEVVGFSGGNKYLFPGVSGPELIDVSHWLGALLTSAAIIGTRGVTPVRALIDEAAALVPGEHLALCAVTRPGGTALHSLSVGEPRAAWAAAVEVSASTHIRRLDRPVERVLSLVSERYDDLWTGAKGFYKVEPVVMDGGEVVLYAPHIDRFSASHPGIAALGYHCRDFFLAHWDRYRDIPWSELAHSTHLRGAGTYDRRTGEHPRVTVTLATSIPEAEVRAAGLGYLDPASVDPESWAGRPGTLVVPDAGEELYRLRGDG
jgi:nickel-dependent lactate racemase